MKGKKYKCYQSKHHTHKIPQDHLKLVSRCELCLSVLHAHTYKQHTHHMLNLNSHLAPLTVPATSQQQIHNDNIYHSHTKYTGTLRCFLVETT